MASGTITGPMTGDYGLQIQWESVPDIATNTSTLTMKVYVLYPSINITNRSGCYTTIAGSKVEFSTSPIKDEYKGSKLLKTRIQVIEHDTDGRKSVKLTAYFPIYLKSESLGWIYEMKATGTAELDNIPRSSEISSQTQSVTVDGSGKWSVAMSRKSDAYWHRATLSIGGYSHTTEPFATTAEYAIPMEWLNAIPDALTGSVNVSVQTYSDSTCTTAVGEPVTSELTMVVPASAAPVISDGWASVAPYNAAVPANGLDLYVQGYSKAEVTFDEDGITTKYGANIVSLEISWDGVAATAAPYRTKILNKSGGQVIRCTATDSRGLKASEDLLIEVQSYAPPSLKGVSLYRCDSSGSADDAGAYIYFKATAVYASIAGQNTLSMKAAYRPVGSNVWIESGLYSGVESVQGGSLSGTSSYEARISASDRLGRTAEFNALIGTADVAFHIRPGGKGAAFGKYAEEDGVLDLGDWDLKTSGNVSAANVSADNLFPKGYVYLRRDGLTPMEAFGGSWQYLEGTGLPFEVFIKR